MSTPDPYPERYPVFERALEHFAKRLLESQNDESVKLGNSFLQKDIKDVADKALEVAEKFKNKQFRLMGVFTDNKQLIHSALEVYIKDLTSSKQVLLETLGCSSLDTQNIDEELFLCQSYIKHCQPRQ